jgi:hypothetical protein
LANVTEETDLAEYSYYKSIETKDDEIRKLGRLLDKNLKDLSTVNELLIISKDNNNKLSEKCAHFKNRIFELINKKSIIQADLKISDRNILKLHERCAALRKNTIQLGNNETNLKADLAYCLEEYAVLRKGLTNKIGNK